MVSALMGAPGENVPGISFTEVKDMAKNYAKGRGDFRDQKLVEKKGGVDMWFGNHGCN